MIRCSWKKSDHRKEVSGEDHRGHCKIRQHNILRYNDLAIPMASVEVWIFHVLVRYNEESPYITTVKISVGNFWQQLHLWWLAIYSCWWACEELSWPFSKKENTKESQEELRRTLGADLEILASVWEAVTLGLWQVLDRLGVGVEHSIKVMEAFTSLWAAWARHWRRHH